MPIQYYCGITMNQNSIVTPVIDPLGTAPSVGTEVEGQQYYNTATNLMYFWNGTAWVEMDGTGSGVLSISIAAAGTNAGGINTSLVIDSSTSANTLQPMQFGGSANIGMVPDASGGTDSVKFLKGDGTWATPGGGGTMSNWLIEADGANSQTVSDGDTLDIVGSTYITAVASAVAAGNYMVTISHDLTSRTDTASAASPAYGAAFTAVDSVTTNSTGHVTALNLKTVTLPAASSRWTAVGETGSEVVSYGDTVNFLNDTNGGIDTKVDTSTADVSVIFQMDVQDLTTNAAPATGDFIPLSPAAGGGTTKATIANIIALAPQGTVESVAGGTYLTNSGSATAVVLNHDLTSRSDTTSTASPAAGATFTAVDSVTSNSTGHVTALNLKTVTLPTDTNTTYALDKAAGSTNLILSAGGTTQDTIQFTAKNSSFTVTGVTEDVYAFGLADDVTIATSLTVSGNAVDALDIVGKGQSAATLGTDVATTLTTKGYVDGLVEGGLTFLGTFRADTGIILSGGNIGLYLYNVPGGAGTRVAITVGDYYVVATAGGDFYANTSYPLDIGDSIIGVEAAVADASVVTDWSLVSQGVTVNAFSNTNTGSTYIDFSTVNTNATGAVDIGYADLNAADGTSDTNTRFLSKDNTWDVPSYTVDTTYSAGTGLTLTGTVFDANVDGTQSVAANTSSTTASRTYNVQVSSTDKLVVNVPWVDTTVTYSTMTSTVLGLGKLFSDTEQSVAATAVSATASRTYGVQMNSSDQLVVNVPWVDTNTNTVTSVTASAVNNRLGLEITPTTGAVVAGLNIVGQTNLASADAVDADELLIYDSTNTTNKAITLAELHSYNNYAVTISAMGTVTHSLNSFDIIVQLYNATTYETIEACVDRATKDTVAISGSVFPAGNIRVLVSKIG